MVVCKVYKCTPNESLITCTRVLLYCYTVTVLLLPKTTTHVAGATPTVGILTCN